MMRERRIYNLKMGYWTHTERNSFVSKQCGGVFSSETMQWSLPGYANLGNKIKKWNNNNNDF